MSSISFASYLYLLSICHGKISTGSLVILFEVTEGLLQIQSFVQGCHFLDVCTVGNVRIKVILIISHVVRFATRENSQNIWKNIICGYTQFFPLNLYINEKQIQMLYTDLQINKRKWTTSQKVKANLTKKTESKSDCHGN